MLNFFMLSRSGIGLFFSLCLLFTTAFSVHGQIDSLKQQLTLTTDSKQRAELVEKIAESFFLSARYDSLLKYGEVLDHLAQQVNDKTLLLLAASKAQFL